jgi:hypothetical protein
VRWWEPHHRDSGWLYEKAESGDVLAVWACAESPLSRGNTAKKSAIQHVVEDFVLVVPPSPHAVDRSCTRQTLLGKIETGRSTKRQNGCNSRAAETTMPDPHLPAETLDHIIGYLHDTEDELRNCCLVSKPWIPRARKHLFADIEFPTEESLRSWKETFPDPLTSPARYAKTLLIDCTTRDAEVGGWIGGFSRVAHLGVRSRG